VNVKDNTGNALLMSVVEIGANRQSCDPSTTLLLKLVLQVVNDVGDNMHQREPAS
jgi:hypothetical protein